MCIRDSGDAVAVGEGGGDALQEAHVLVVQVDVDEAAQLAAVQQSGGDARVAGVEVLEEFPEVAAGALDGLGAVGVGAEDGRDADLDGHGCAPVRVVRWVGRSGRGRA